MFKLRFVSFLVKNSLQLCKKLPRLALLLVRLLRCWHPETGGQWLWRDVAEVCPGCVRVALDVRSTRVHCHFTIWDETEVNPVHDK